MSFPKQFEQWLLDAVRPGVPEDVQAFSFNLFEPARKGSKFGIELVGAGRFDRDDQDWACEEVWEPKLRSLAIPVAFASDGWEGCLEKMRRLLLTTLGRDDIAAVLKSRRAIGIGFVDGDLEILWEKSAAKKKGQATARSPGRH